MEATLEVQEVSLEKVIETKLIQNNVTEQVLAALKEKYAGMKLKALDDKESYLELKAAAKDCAKVRTLTTKLCKEGRERAVKEQKLWIAKEKEIIGQVAEVEDALDSEIALFDTEVDRKANEEKKRQEEAYINRQAQLTKMGAVYIGGSFVLGEASFESELVKGASDDVWDDAVVPKFKSEYEKIEAVRIEEENKKAQAEAEMKRQQEELLKQQAELKAQQEEMQRKQAESERLVKEKQQAEQAEKDKANAALQSKRFEIMFPYAKYGDSIDMNILWVLAESDFIERLESKKSEFEKFQAEKAKLDEEKILSEIESAKQAAIEEQLKKQAEEARIAEIKKQQEELKRVEELAQASDKVKYADLIEKITVITFPEMRSGQYRKKISIIREKIEEILSL